MSILAVDLVKSSLAYFTLTGNEAARLMWTDPMYTLERAHERQREIAREVDARHSVAAPAPGRGAVVRAWLTALRIFVFGGRPSTEPVLSVDEGLGMTNEGGATRGVRPARRAGERFRG